jgi:hypothetical protein
MPLEKLLDPGLKVLPGEIDPPGAGQMIERGGLDSVNELPGFASGGNHVKEAARPGRFAVEIQNPPREKVVPSEIVKEPGIKTE